MMNEQSLQALEHDAKIADKSDGRVIVDSDDLRELIDAYREREALRVRALCPGCNTEHTARITAGMLRDIPIAYSVECGACK